ncbi:tRNA (adenosine(37)-N6)-threonylcarbamoyltransferase complex dimerization subunit type 1 TsaB [Borrelia persica]|uniref:tRNA (adenosine(37)-N6)-threonylcarbamoyltransferase complex dimerization subunit type 1 TsaB n=1 Tax=Borrelia persica TaxID=44448 RepID=UPI0004640525|nr:tRNA (adenosine(37)-N6)-threonylcarbamoyltransferase complex dimerization subunit type 1 TsaB [Borrelia persica]
MNTFAIEYSYKTLLFYFKINEEIFFLFKNKDEVNRALNIPKLFNDFVVDNNINLLDLDLLINSSGPGSFTGLRISLSFIKGLSLGLEIPFVNVPTFDVFVKVVKVKSDVLVLSFTAGRYFIGHYRDCKLCGNIICFSEAELFQYLDKLDFKFVVVGNGIEFIYEKLNEKLKGQFKSINDIYAFGAALTELGKLKYLESRHGDDILSGPCYVRLSDAEINSYLLK